MIRTKGEAGAGDTVEAVRHVRMLHKEIKMVQNMSDNELLKDIGGLLDLFVKANNAAYIDTDE